MGWFWWMEQTPSKMAGEESSVPPVGSEEVHQDSPPTLVRALASGSALDPLTPQPLRALRAAHSLREASPVPSVQPTST